MTDFEKLEKVFKEIGLDYSIINATKEENKEVATYEYDGKINWDKFIAIDNGIGYYDFICEFYFLKGKFQGHGCWE